jgi:hypothetical protein
MNKYIVTGRWERHKRKFELSAQTWAEAEHTALTLIDSIYSRGSGKTYGQSVWQFGAISMREVGGQTAVIREAFADQIFNHLSDFATGE